MLRHLRRRLAHSSLFAFNPIFRDRWVRARAAETPAGARVLDVGAGSCPYRNAFSHCRYETQDFTQLTPEQLRYGGYGRIDYVCDASAIPVPDGSFDAVLCTEMLEHVPDPVAVVRELGRVLRPGGRLMLTAPLGSGIHQEPYHFVGGFTPFWYQRFLTEAGFQDITVEANGGSLLFFGQESIRFMRSTRPFKDLPASTSLWWAPLWLALLPILGVLIPAVTHLLDRHDGAQRQTVGYHVTAVKGGAASAP